MSAWNVRLANTENGMNVEAETAEDAVKSLLTAGEVIARQIDGDTGTLFVTSIGDYVVTAVAEDQDDRIPVLLHIHTGAVQGGNMMFASTAYAVPTEVIAQVQRLLEKYQVA